MTHRFTAGDFAAFRKFQSDSIDAIKREMQRLEDGDQFYDGAFLEIVRIANAAMDWTVILTGDLPATPAVLRDAGRAAQ